MSGGVKGRVRRCKGCVRQYSKEASVLLVQQYELESRLQKDLLRVDEEKRQRIADVQNQRKKEELERLQEKNRRQHEYMSALKEQQVSFPRF